MQLDALVLYHSDGNMRQIRFRPGQLNIITGESGTGKSSIIGILRFLLGGDSPHVPLGPIQNTVDWYGLLAHAGNTHFFVGRPAPDHGAATTQAFLAVEETAIPPRAGLHTNASASDVVDYLGSLIGIAENLHVPAAGQTRRPLAANLRHALYYCFQGQGEIANPELLFHHQNREHQKQAIRDTLPYFLGAQDPDALRKRQELSEVRRELRRTTLRLDEARATRELGVGRAAGLIADAKASGLIAPDALPTDTRGAFEILTSVLSSEESPVNVDDADSDGEMERLLARRTELRSTVRDLNDKIRGLDEFARVGNEYSSELNEHRVRLASVGLIPDKQKAAATCPICENTLDTPSARAAITQSLERVSQRIDLAHRDEPRVAQARAELLQARSAARTELADIDTALDDLAQTDQRRETMRRSWEQQSFVRGRIAQYLDTATLADDDAMAALEHTVENLERRAASLNDELDPEQLRSAVNSLLNIVGRRMTALAQSLPLEHSEHGVRIDPYRLTVVADTLQGPAYMDAGAIGSGMSWVGYHLTAYLALQDYFIEAHRPVPRFIVLDQPSQAFFPRDRDTGGDLTELSDVDRTNTRKLYEMMFNVVTELDGQLQVIAFDHADFPEPWFGESVVEFWREGNALIPQNWLNPDTSDAHAENEE
ncbi:MULTISPECIES: DUF3732 domain-containing protein [unclassified Saccharopolyspora]|uniref:DUF3732 domain-containing protein n=1 Tax=unclassified Saccharopolyspora TaxID=2646250 RepID=UPI001CD1AA24|nr:MULTISPECIES: DUF3732 domain-containing protein [unclassified Saccharopolyspora]MCA1190018.1 DUF3732 domain-containing protein [Saccharopolyspora sp. 6T]MCA1279711.1 DUF3732 domain-containing protein [Saccharopolyspora sp. 7B]